jgi:hypothetical protein
VENEIVYEEETVECQQGIFLPELPQCKTGAESGASVDRASLLILCTTSYRANCPLLTADMILLRMRKPVHE